MIRHLIQDEAGSDIIEYSLLLAFLVLMGVGAMLSVGQSASSMWSISNSRLSAAGASKIN